MGKLYKIFDDSMRLGNPNALDNNNPHQTIVDAKLYVILPVYNRREITKRFVNCLTGQSYQNYHLLLIDDGSMDGTAGMVREMISSLTVIQGDGHWWWGGSLQQGYEWLKIRSTQPEDIVLIINDDTEFETNFLERGAAALKAHSNALLLAQCYDRHTNEIIDTGVHVDWKRLKFSVTKNQRDINCLSTRGLFLKAGDFLKMGGFHPILVPHYLSDYEFTIRAHKKGMKLISDPFVKIRLDGDETAYRTFKNDTLGIFLKRYFSIKSVSNPIYWTSFLCLVCPWPWKPVNICRVWLWTVQKIVTALNNSLRVLVKA